MSKIENLELKKNLTVDVIGSRGLNMYNCNSPIFDESGKLLKKRIGQIGTTLAKPANEIRIAIREDNSVVGFARVKNRDNWKLTDSNGDNEALIERAATIRSGYAEKPHSEQLLDMRFDTVESVRGLLERFYPNLKYSGSQSVKSLRSKYGAPLISTIVKLMGYGETDERITTDSQGEIETEKWVEILSTCREEYNSTLETETE